MDALVLEWFADIHAGCVDRDRLSGDYSRHLTDAMVQSMFECMKEHDCGAATVGRRSFANNPLVRGEFYAVVFPCADSTSPLSAFDRPGKITAISLRSMAGD